VSIRVIWAGRPEGQCFTEDRRIHVRENLGGRLETDHVEGGEAKARLVLGQGIQALQSAGRETEQQREAEEIHKKGVAVARAQFHEVLRGRVEETQASAHMREVFGGDRR